VADETVEVAGSDLLALADAVVELLQHVAGHLAGALGARQDDDIAVGVGLDAEAVLDQGKVGVELSQELGQTPVVLEWHHNPLVGCRRLGVGRPSTRGSA
jgi:hypothetical protein